MQSNAPSIDFGGDTEKINLICAYDYHTNKTRTIPLNEAFKD